MLYRFIASLLVLVGLAACRDDQIVGSGKGPTPQPVTQARALVDGGTSLVGTTRQAKFEIICIGGTPSANVVWSSTDTSVATVSAQGIVSSRNVGVTTIRAGSACGEDPVLAAATHYVIAAGTTTNTIAYYGTNQVLLYVGDSVHLQPIQFGDTTVANGWGWNNSEVVEVDRGMVVGLSPGFTQVYTMYTNGTQTLTEVTVRARPETPAVIVEQPLDLVLGLDSIRVLVGDSVTLGAKVVGGPQGSSREVIWTSMNATVATVDKSGRLVGLKPGVIGIRVCAKASPNMCKYVQVRVFAPSCPAPAPGPQPGNGDTTVVTPPPPTKTVDLKAEWKGERLLAENEVRMTWGTRGAPKSCEASSSPFWEKWNGPLPLKGEAVKLSTDGMKGKYTLKLTCTWPDGTKMSDSVEIEVFAK